MMKLQMKGIHYLLFCCVILSGSMCASAAEHRQSRSSRYTQLNHVEGIAAVGIANIWGNNSQIGVTSSETDRLVQTNRNNWGTLDVQLGAGYVYYFHQKRYPTKNVQWFPAIEPQVNLYYLNSNTGIKGNVLRFDSAAFSQLTYRIPVRSTRLMLDVALTVIKKKQSSLYVKAGIGNAWNRLGYTDYVNGLNSECGTQRLSLNTSSNSHFVWEVGVGLLHDFNNNVGLSLEYLFTDFGRVQTSAHGSAGTITAPVIVPASFTMKAQTAALGLHYAI